MPNKKTAISARCLLTQALSFTFIGVMLSLSNSASADAQREAGRLLVVTNLGNKFQSIAQEQTRIIIRTYTSIVSTSVEINLPRHLTQTIAACYSRSYAWNNFEAGIINILAEQLTEKEMRLLIDFYQDRGLPPMEIQAFKDIINKADNIEQLSAEYIYTNSDSCVEKDVELIIAYLAGRRTISEAFTSAP
jgi:hypothetical protein